MLIWFLCAAIPNLMLFRDEAPWVQFTRFRRLFTLHKWRVVWPNQNGNLLFTFAAPQRARACSM